MGKEKSNDDKSLLKFNPNRLQKRSIESALADIGPKNLIKIEDGTNNWRINPEFDTSTIVPDHDNKLWLACPGPDCNNNWRLTWPFRLAVCVCGTAISNPINPYSALLHKRKSRLLIEN